MGQLQKWRLVENDDHKTSQGSIKLSDLFWEIWHKSYYKLPNSTDNYCYIFELLHVTTVDIVQYLGNGEIVLHGIRDLTSFKEIWDIDSIAQTYGWKSIKSVTFSNLENLLENCRQLNPTKNPGYVLCDENFNRTNILSPQYIALKELHPWNDKNRNFRLMIDLIRTNDDHTFLEHFPEWDELYHETKLELSNFCNYVQSIYDDIRHKGPGHYAAVANQYAFYGLLFQIRKEGFKVKSISKYISSIRLSWLLGMMKGWKEGRKRT